MDLIEVGYELLTTISALEEALASPAPRIPTTAKKETFISAYRWNSEMWSKDLRKRMKCSRIRFLPGKHTPADRTARCRRIKIPKES
jgi:hypothetical protein